MQVEIKITTNSIQSEVPVIQSVMQNLAKNKVKGITLIVEEIPSSPVVVTPPKAAE